MPDYRKPKPARGWSYPLNATEVGELFPGVGSLYWTPGQPSKRFLGGLAFSLRWQPRSAMPQPVLTIFAVPSEQRSVIRSWVLSTAAPEAQQWLEAIEDGGPVSRDMKHHRDWVWGTVA